jgi:pimeloyl-ACP methyl ester carboxylesterase
VKLRENQPVSAANALRQVLAAARFRLGPQPLDSKKLLVLAGAGDTLVSPECSLALAKAWNCAMARHPTAGHDVTLDAGPWVAEQVARWA